MLNFSFHNPTRIHFGEGQISRVAREIPTDASVLVVYGGGSIQRNGVYQQVEAALSQHQWHKFGGITSNPQHDAVIKALALIKEYRINYLLAVGGGSVIDATKYIAAASCFDGKDTWDIFAKQAKVKKALPIGVVQTLPATGSESNPVAVISRGDEKRFFASARIRPLFAILDPSISFSLSPRQVSNGVVDAFVHVIEQYLTYPVNAKVQDRFAEGLLQTLVEEGPKALADDTKDNFDIRANIMWSASLALNDLIGLGVPQDWTTHMIGHEITAAFNVDHARTLSIMLPAVIKHQRECKAEKLLQYAERVWGITEGSNEEKIKQAITATENFFRSLKMPVRFSDVNIDVTGVEKIVQQLEKSEMIPLGEHQNISLEHSREILNLAL